MGKPYPRYCERSEAIHLAVIDRQPQRSGGVDGFVSLAIDRYGSFTRSAALKPAR